MAYRSIVPANVRDIPVGTRVRFNYGALHGSEYGTVVGFHIDRFGAALNAVTDGGEVKGIHGITNIGIGTYLVDPKLSEAFLGEP